MTKEELKQEARQKALEWNNEKINGKYNRPPIANWSCYEKGYLAGAEPRERQIEIDAKQIRALQKQNGELTDELTKKADTNHQLVEQSAKMSEENAELKEKHRELEAQLEQEKNLSQCRFDHNEQLRELIEKMKNCFNCAKGDWNNRVKCIKSGCVNKDKWEIKEK